jgi:hypothetical protein
MNIFSHGRLALIVLHIYLVCLGTGVMLNGKMDLLMVHRRVLVSTPNLLEFPKNLIECRHL